ncbi:MAG: NAD(P)-dependent oxidoreductase [Lachnospiraceae bacterium]|nr:NAD(P)-dependent oxidoreductase [Lachnospiraceae bacterium]
MKKVLITGANGFLGKHLQKELASRYSIIATNRHSENELFYLDLLDKRSVECFLRNMNKLHIDAIIHTAARLVDGTMTKDDEMKVLEDNLEITKNTIKLANQLKCDTFINCSSMAVYPNEDGVYNEKSEIRMSCNTDCLYGLSKFCAENMFDYGIQSECRIIHLRLAQIYGDGLREDRIIPVMKQGILDKNVIEVFGNGERVSSFVSIEFVCKIIKNMLENKNAKGIYNVGEENLSYKQLAERVKKKYGNENTVIKMYEQGSRKRFFLDTQKICSFCQQDNSLEE